MLERAVGMRQRRQPPQIVKLLGGGIEPPLRRRGTQVGEPLPPLVDLALEQAEGQPSAQFGQRGTALGGAIVERARQAFAEVVDAAARAG